MVLGRTDPLGDPPDEATLTRDMAGIGMNFAAEPNPDAPIEETLIHTSVLGMEDHDLRVLAVLTMWLGIHHRHLDIDHLLRCLSEHPSERVRAYWAAVARWLEQDPRLKPLTRLYDGPALDVLPIGTDFQLARRGEDKRFTGSTLRVPAGALREREGDVLSADALIRQYAGYRDRVRQAGLAYGEQQGGRRRRAHQEP